MCMKNNPLIGKTRECCRNKRRKPLERALPSEGFAYMLPTANLTMGNFGH